MRPRHARTTNTYNIHRSVPFFGNITTRLALSSVAQSELTSNGGQRLRARINLGTTEHGVAGSAAEQELSAQRPQPFSLSVFQLPHSSSRRCGLADALNLVGIMMGTLADGQTGLANSATVPPLPSYRSHPMAVRGCQCCRILISFQQKTHLFGAELFFPPAGGVAFSNLGWTAKVKYGYRTTQFSWRCPTRLAVPVARRVLPKSPISWCLQTNRDTALLPYCPPSSRSKVARVGRGLSTSPVGP
ncbi:hypothetical protein F4780DRAFT_750992 [Xylariomycetidae sp. FL0641]|nr:hypothetical protein F4780DRAFT_750992 [Xylariomycetidae sp. FL0641]